MLYVKELMIKYKKHENRLFPPASLGIIQTVLAFSTVPIVGHDFIIIRIVVDIILLMIYNSITVKTNRRSKYRMQFSIRKENEK